MKALYICAFHLALLGCICFSQTTPTNIATTYTVTSNLIACCKRALVLRAIGEAGRQPRRRGPVTVTKRLSLRCNSDHEEQRRTRQFLGCDKFIGGPCL